VSAVAGGFHVAVHDFVAVDRELLHVRCIYIVGTYKHFGGPVGRSLQSVCETMTALYPRPTALLGRFAPCVAP